MYYLYVDDEIVVYNDQILSFSTVMSASRFLKSLFYLYPDEVNIENSYILSGGEAMYCDSGIKDATNLIASYDDKKDEVILIKYNGDWS